jgi:hypothetical protein
VAADGTLLRKHLSGHALTAAIEEALAAKPARR